MSDSGESEYFSAVGELCGSDEEDAGSARESTSRDQTITSGERKVRAQTAANLGCWIDTASRPALEMLQQRFMAMALQAVEHDFSLQNVLSTASEATPAQHSSDTVSCPQQAYPAAPQLATKSSCLTTEHKCQDPACGTPGYKCKDSGYSSRPFTPNQPAKTNDTSTSRSRTNISHAPVVKHPVPVQRYPDSIKKTSIISSTSIKSATPSRYRVTATRDSPTSQPPVQSQQKTYEERAAALAARQRSRREQYTHDARVEQFVYDAYVSSTQASTLGSGACLPQHKHLAREGQQDIELVQRSQKTTATTRPSHSATTLTRPSQHDITSPHRCHPDATLEAARRQCDTDNIPLSQLKVTLHRQVRNYFQYGNLPMVTTNTGPNSLGPRLVNHKDWHTRSTYDKEKQARIRAKWEQELSDLANSQLLKGSESVIRQDHIEQHQQKLLKDQRDAQQKLAQDSWNYAQLQAGGMEHERLQVLKKMQAVAMCNQ